MSNQITHQPDLIPGNAWINPEPRDGKTLAEFVNRYRPGLPEQVARHGRRHGSFPFTSVPSAF